MLHVVLALDVGYNRVLCLLLVEAAGSCECVRCTTSL
jgi:hypothetical protein